ncbi:hypothetical protein N7540_002611 [Penicillium herquei]|nr:hypothetical protein N7540_002611 [Penicillium herquei]
MTPLTIEISGTSTVSRQPDQAVLRLHVKSQGLFKEAVVDEVTNTSNNLMHRFLNRVSQHLPDEVPSFSSTKLCTWLNLKDSHRHESDTKTASSVCHAVLSYKVSFRNFDILKDFSKYLKEYPNVVVHSIEWQLTEESDKALATLARKMAMRDAIKKATDLAEVVERKVVPTKIHDSGSRRFYPPNQAPVMLPQMVPEGDLSSPARSYGSGNLNWGDNHRHEVIDTNPDDIRYTGSVEVQLTEVDKSSDG